MRLRGWEMEGLCRLGLVFCCVVGGRGPLGLGLGLKVDEEDGLRGVEDDLDERDFVEGRFVDGGFGAMVLRRL